MLTTSTHSNRIRRSILTFGACILLLFAVHTHAQRFSEWSAPENLGATINTPALRGWPYISKGGRSLYFATDRTVGSGPADISVSRRESVDDPCGLPVDLGPVADGGPPASVAFNSSRDGNPEIYVMNPGGTEQTRITSNSAADNQPHLSPNGKEVVFRSNRITPTNPSGDFEIFAMNIDGTEVRQLTSNTADDVWPRWSPNGKQIAFHSNVDRGDFEIYTINADGTDLTRVTIRPGVDQWPAWSPDGKKLAIRRDMDIYIIDLRGREEPVRLTLYPTTIDQMPAWSPNGRQLAFMSMREGYCSVFVMDSDGSSQINLTPKDPADPPAAWCSRAPSWSRNGQHIYFMSVRPGTGGTADIFVMNADGTEVQQLTSAGGHDEFPTVR